MSKKGATLDARVTHIDGVFAVDQGVAKVEFEVSWSVDGDEGERNDWTWRFRRHSSTKRVDDLAKILLADVKNAPESIPAEEIEKYVRDRMKPFKAL